MLLLSGLSQLFARMTVARACGITKEPLRRRLSAIAREQQARRVRGEVTYTLDRIGRLQTAFAAGPRSDAIAAFSEMRPSQVTAAIRQSLYGPDDRTNWPSARLSLLRAPGTSCWDELEFHARFLEALTDRK